MVVGWFIGAYVLVEHFSASFFLPLSLEPSRCLPRWPPALPRIVPCVMLCRVMWTSEPFVRLSG